MIELIYLLLFISITLIILFMPVINGNYVAWSLMRYNIYALYFGIFSISFLTYKLQDKLNLSPRPIIVILVLLIISNSILTYQKVKENNIKQGITEFLHYYPESVAKVDSLARDHDLSNGIASYWQAKYISMFSKENLRVFTVFESLAPWYHVMNENWYYLEDGSKNLQRKFDFIINKSIDYDEILKYLGTPKDSIYLNGVLEVYTFNDFVFNKDTRRPYIP